MGKFPAVKTSSLIKNKFLRFEFVRKICNLSYSNIGNFQIKFSNIVCEKYKLSNKNILWQPLSLEIKILDRIFILILIDLNLYFYFLNK